MIAEIKVLKKGNNKGSNSNKKGNKKSNQVSKEKTTKTPKKKKKKKKTNNKWDWKNSAPKDTNAKKDGALVREFQKRTYFWCPHHNNGAAMWTIHHPKDFANKKDNDSSPRANVVTLTLWTVILTDGGARVKLSLGSG